MTTTASTTSRLRPLDVATMASQPAPPVPWLVDGLLVPGEVTMLSGAPGCGKSLLSMALVRGVLAGSPVAGLGCRAGRAMIVDAENGPGEIHRRLRGSGIGAADVDGLAIFEAAGFDLAKREDIDDLTAQVQAHGAAVVVLDSLASLAPGLRENDAERVGPVLQAAQGVARATGAAVLLLHHQGKGAERSPYRGSSAIAANVTVGVALDTLPGDPEPQRRRVSWWKSRPAAAPEATWIALSRDGGGLVDAAEPFEGPTTAERTPTVRKWQTVTAAVREAVAEHGPQPSRAAVARLIDCDSKGSAFRTAVERLESDGFAVTTAP